jgi:hypothetical protein
MSASSNTPDELIERRADLVGPFGPVYTTILRRSTSDSASAPIVVQQGSDAGGAANDVFMARGGTLMGANPTPYQTLNAENFVPGTTSDRSWLYGATGVNVWSGRLEAAIWGRTVFDDLTSGTMRTSLPSVYPPPTLPARPPTCAWLEDAIRNIDEFQAETDEQAPAFSKTIDFGKQVVRICAQFDVPEPLSDVDEEGNIEIFVKKGARGVLFVVGTSDTLQVFGNVDGDNWRARYSLLGNSWHRHLPTFIASIAGT